MSSYISWKAPEHARLPDFIICGAMKCGTSTVHGILNSHPKVSIPEKEIHFFDIDDQLEHGCFSFPMKTRWAYPDMDTRSAELWQWYSDFFSSFPKDHVVGEDSTGYIASKGAISRISIQNKPVKLIVCLRHPTKRAYSQYWHMLRTGRGMFSFNDTIRFTPHQVLSRSLYLSQIETLLDCVPRERIFFFVLEEFLDNKREVAERLAEFIGISPGELPGDAHELHTNQAKVPKFITLQILKNRMLRSFGNAPCRAELPYGTTDKIGNEHFKTHFNRVYRRLNPQSHRRAPSMDSKTEAFLDQYFQRELAGIDELIGKPVSDTWFKSRSTVGISQGGHPD